MLSRGGLIERDSNMAAKEREKKYEYLDHTADVQLHAWGDDLTEAFEQVGIAMYGYMTDLDTVDNYQTENITAQEPFFIGKDIQINEFDKENFRIQATVHGEIFDLDKHPQGTEVKAITYSTMQVYDTDEKHEVYVIIDI